MPVDPTSIRDAREKRATARSTPSAIGPRAHARLPVKQVGKRSASDFERLRSNVPVRPDNDVKPHDVLNPRPSTWVATRTDGRAGFDGLQGGGE